MSQPATLNPRIIEALYSHALVLSDDVRHTFALAIPAPAARLEDDPVRVALCAEGLRTTTRMMHAIAWLLNHRAYFRHEITDLQRRRHARLCASLLHSERSQLALLDDATTDLIAATCALYTRLLRLDHAWRLASDGAASPIRHLQASIERRLAS
ncbi:DUF1465 family protein [Novosphingobium sp. Leaf2]|uniref:DUF1465 family protein n=1 Tax=Novosphingobium sp. Leaf2 TaxID=1735670 RepID=UPI0006FE30D4|nr:DUF1465 family protein [Novosphingobium sp. Leaf2]KQM19511.1 AraC family transcriptional regulator [Novosphingobium sp. Leaf2]